MAKRSATECASILDIGKRLQLFDEGQFVKGRELLVRIVAMLIKMARMGEAVGGGPLLPPSGAGTHAGTGTN